MESKEDMTLDEALDLFVTRLQGRLDDHFAKHYPNVDAPKIELEHGRKFVKVVKVREHGSRSVHSFIAKRGGTTKSLGTVLEGDILKAASWKQPARHVRGSVFSEAFEGYGVSEFGAHYL